ncbi:hypothetical protein PHLCEN_2v13249 [Hermanssonia centrifuga]|uniref:Uncharacterized protein n=1 Tax=Hermanssonia centrifuga TaxID=98765 RepID=A0A2R6NES2_9APHY|nr:hypothetical protein PHLCEN_2v13249 [Hermanssonia centrifuga]
MNNQDHSRLQPILISRFLLNLRQVGREHETNDIFTSRLSVLGFRVPTLPSMVADMGGSVGLSRPDEMDDTNEESDDSVVLDTEPVTLDIVSRLSSG